MSNIFNRQKKLSEEEIRAIDEQNKANPQEETKQKDEGSATKKSWTDAPRWSKLKKRFGQ